MPTTADLINNAVETKPIDFADTFNNLVGQKLVDALANRKIQLAQAIYSSGPEEGEDDDEEFDFDLNDDDLDDDEDDEYFSDDDEFTGDDDNEDA